MRFITGIMGAQLPIIQGLVVGAARRLRYRNDTPPHHGPVGCNLGEVAEWSKAAVLKTVEGKPSGGSNPSLSANHPAARKIELWANSLLAMEIAGLSDSRLYVGSWSQSICDPERPVEPADT